MPYQNKSSKRVADATPLSDYERPYIAQALLEAFIGDWKGFQERAIEIFDDNNGDFVLMEWDEIIKKSKRSKRVARYKKTIEQFAEKLGLRATWGAQETHAIIHGAAITRMNQGQERWRPLGGLALIGAPKGFLIEIKQPVSYPDEWTQVSETILKQAREQYEAGRMRNNWGTPPTRKTNPTLSRNVHWLFERITLRKSVKEIARQAQFANIQQHKRSGSSQALSSVTESDVKQAISRTAKLVRIRLR